MDLGSWHWSVLSEGCLWKYVLTYTKETGDPIALFSFEDDMVNSALLYRHKYLCFNYAAHTEGSFGQPRTHNKTIIQTLESNCFCGIKQVFLSTSWPSIKWHNWLGKIDASGDWYFQAGLGYFSMGKQLRIIAWVIICNDPLHYWTLATQTN